MSDYPYFCTDCNEGRGRLTEDGRCTMCHGARIITHAKLPAKQTQLTEFFDQLVEPRPICGNCEYFDGGGMRQDGSWVHFDGDCHNKNSDRFQTNQNETCALLWPCSTRWPDCDHD